SPERPAFDAVSTRLNLPVLRHIRCHALNRIVRLQNPEFLEHYWLLLLISYKSEILSVLCKRQVAGDRIRMNANEISRRVGHRRIHSDRAGVSRARGVRSLW